MVVALEVWFDDDEVYIKRFYEAILKIKRIFGGKVKYFIEKNRFNENFRINLKILNLC